jgi:hypothetical protein
MARWIRATASISAVAVLVAAGLALTRSSTGRGTSEPVLLASADGPFLPGARPVRIELKRLESGESASLSSQLDRLGGNQRLFLVLRGASAEGQPGVLFRLFLDLPGSVPPDARDPHVIGTLNFFRALPATAGGNSTAELFESYDVTGPLATLRRRQMLSEPTTITIAPVGVPDPHARVAIGRVELIRQ